MSAASHAAPARPRALVDETHCGRHVTGIERITLELFSASALAPFDVAPLRSASRQRMMLDQLVTLPWRARAMPDALVLCSGFPPTPPVTLLGDRVVTYIHDLFLLTRPQDLNWRARAWMAPSLRFALKRLNHFLVNSQSTLAELRGFARPGADIRLYRPEVRNVLGLGVGDRASRATTPGPRLIALGTVEPRKNLGAAADIVAALQARGYSDAHLDIVGREGWGGEADRLRGRPGVTLHGYLPIEDIRRLVDDADLFISTSHAEGLGLPLLEAQYAGLPVVAADHEVFREVLGFSGVMIDAADAAAAADRVAAFLQQPDWRRAGTELSAGNIARWNAEARADHAAVLDWLLRLSADLKR